VNQIEENVDQINQMDVQNPPCESGKRTGAYSLDRDAKSIERKD